MQNTKILVILGWRTTACSGGGLLTEKHGINAQSLPSGLMRYYDTQYNAEYFGVKLMEIDETDLRGSNSINYLDVSERYGVLFDLLSKSNIHIDYKIGRARLWVVPKK